MRLLAVSHTGWFSGAETVLLRALQAATAEGWTVRCASPEGPLSQRLMAADVQRIALPDLKLGSGPRPMTAARLLGATLIAARRLQHASAGADLVLANGLQTLLPLRLARPGAPVTWLVHDVLQRPDRLRYLRASAPVVDLAIAVSDAVRTPLEAAGIPTTVVRNGTVWPVGPARGSSGVRTVIGCNAQLTPWKGQHVLLDAIGLLQRDDVVVELMGAPFPGDEPFAERLQERASQPDLAGQVRFAGFCPEPLIRMRTWDIAVSSSVDPEAAPLSVLEAMSLGLPMVATAHGGTPEVLGEAGLLVAPGDPAAMARALERLLDDAELHARCARAGPQVIATALTLQHQEQRLLDTLRNARRPDVLSRR